MLLTADDLPRTLQRAADDLCRYQGWVATLPPHDALDAIYHHGDVLARFAAAAPAPVRVRVLARLRALLSASLALDGGRYLTPYALVRAFRKGAVPAPASKGVDAVRLLTIHGAKGLEAELVLLLDADPEPPATRSMQVLVHWPGEHAAPRQLVFLTTAKQAPASVEALLQTEAIESDREELNALYVAMTRARHELVLSSAAPHRANAGSPWKRVSPLAKPVTVTGGPDGDAVPSAELKL